MFWKWWQHFWFLRIWNSKQLGPFVISYSLQGQVRPNILEKEFIFVWLNGKYIVRGGLVIFIYCNVSIISLYNYILYSSKDSGAFWNSYHSNIMVHGSYLERRNPYDNLLFWNLICANSGIMWDKGRCWNISSRSSIWKKPRTFCHRRISTKFPTMVSHLPVVFHHTRLLIAYI